MATDFDISDYFARRARADATEELVNPIQDKYLAVQRASAEKVEILNKSAEVARQRQELASKSIVNRLGVNPDSTAGGLINAGSSLVEGAVNVEKNIATGVHTFHAANIDAHIPDEAKAAYSRVKEGKATDADRALLGRKAGDTFEPLYPEAYQKQITDGAETNLQRIERFNEAVGRANQVREGMDVSSIVNKGAQEDLSSDLSKGYKDNAPKVAEGWDGLKKGEVLSGSADVAKGLAGLLTTIGAGALNNKQASLELISTNLPQLALAAGGPAGMAMTNIPYAVDAFGQGIQEYQKANNGALPPQDKMREMAGLAASLAVAESLGDKLVLGGGAATKGVKKLFGAGVKEGAEATTETAAREGLKAALKNNVVTRTAGAAAEGAVGEFATEAYQTWGENTINGKPSTLEDSFVGGALGAIAGAGLSSGAHLLHETAGHGSKEKGTADAAAEQTTGKAVESAIASGDVTALADPKSATYAPEKAIAALHANALGETATPESKQTNLTKAGEIVSSLEEAHTKAQDTYDSLSPEGAEKNVKLLARLKEDIAKVDPTDKVALANAQENVSLAQEQVDSMKSVDPKDLAQAKKELDAATGRLEKAQAAVASFNQDLKTSTSLEEHVAVLNTSVDPKDAAAVAAHSTAAESIINLSMAAPERLDTKTATALASNMANGLSTEQRAYLRAFSDARVAENKLLTLSDVSKRIYTGEGRDVGIAQYRERVTAALASGNRATADRNLASLSKFEADHKAKAEVASQALSEHEATGQPVEVLSNGNGGWSISQSAHLSERQRRDNGGLLIHKGTPTNLVPNLVTEAAALTAAVSELNAAYAVKFPSKKASNVSIAPQAHDAPSTQAPAKQAVEAVGSDSKAKGAVPDAGRPQPVVDATPVPGTTPDPQSTAVTTVDSGVSDASAKSLSTQGAPQSLEEYKESTTSPAVASRKAVLPESAEQTVDQTASSSEKESGQLTVMRQKSTEGTAFNARNLLADYFSQSAGREGDSTLRPLVEVKNFLSEGWKNLSDYLQNAELTDNQHAVLRDFSTKAVEWRTNIEKNLSKKANDAFRYEDMSQFLLTETGGKVDLDENAKTAISYAAFSWIAEDVARSATNTDEEINNILLRDEGAPVDDSERAMLAAIGTRQNVVVNTLGQRVVQALGLVASKDAPKDLMPRLESALGAHAFKLLMDQGIVTRTTLSGEEMANLTGNASTDSTAQFQFVKLNRDSPQAAGIYKSSRSTQGVLDKLFSVESGLKDPANAPIPFDQKKTKNTNQDVPSKLAAIVERENAVPSYVRQDMWQLITQLDGDLALQMAGAVSEDAGTTHAANLASSQAKNDGLARELERFQDYVGDFLQNQADGLETPMFFEHTVWKQQRVGIATNTINPQTSKIHRHMTFRKSWETKVDFGNADQMDNFRLRVAEGLGVKTDKQSNEKSLEAFEAKATNPAIEKAVSVLRKGIYEGGLTREDQLAITAGVKAGGENFHSLDALVALAHHAQAAKEDKTEFTTSLMGEVDGVTNGPMLTHLLLGAAGSVKDLFSLLNKGGFYEVGSEANQYNLWRGIAGNLDLYESTIKNVLGNVGNMTRLSPNDKRRIDPLKLEAIYAFTGELQSDKGEIVKAGRNIIKTPLTAMVFGSSLGKSVDSMANKFVESIYGKIEDLAAGKSKLSREDLIRHLETLGVKVPANTTVQELMGRTFSAAETQRLMGSFKNSIGKAVKGTMETDFADFIEQRKTFNLAAQATFDLYNSAYTALRAQMVSELVAKGEIAVNEKTGKALHDLTPKQEAELRTRLSSMTPVMNTLMSKESGSLKGGLYISKSGRKLSQDAVYEGSIKFGTKFSDNGASSTKTHGYETVETAPGVAMLPMSVHSTDSAISHSAADGSGVLNVHDAHGTGLGTFEQTARNLNQATWNAMLDYSPAAEMFSALSRTIVGLAGSIETLPPAAKENLASALGKLAEKMEVAPSNLLQILANEAKSMAFHADDMKLQALNRLQSIDQYALQGGNYEVTQENRAEAAARRAELTSALTEKENQAIEQINAFLSNELPSKVPSLVQDPEMDTPITSPYGLLGESSAKSDPALVKFFEEKPVASSQEVIRALYDSLKEQSGPGAEFNLMLLKMLNKTVSKDLSVRMITPTTADGVALEKSTNAARGWFVAKGNKEEIYVLSPEFENSGLTNETLLHELTHGALARTVANELAAKQADPNYTSEALSLVNELEVLRNKAQDYVNKNSVEGFEPALADIQEFLTWGMTNQKFQNEVIAKTSIQSKTRNNSLVNISGMKAFIQKIVGLLFQGSEKSRQAITVNGMTALVSNVSGLFAAAAQSKTLDTVNLSMASNPMGAARNLSTLEIHDALSGTDVAPEFDAHLRDVVLGSIVEKLQGPFSAFKADWMKNAAGTPMDVWQKALATGSAPLALSAQASPLKVSDKEAHAMEQVEATFKLALDTTTTKLAYKELSDLYTEVSKKLSAKDFHDGDWANATQNERDVAQEKHDYLFKIEQGVDGRSNYLSRFAAFGLAHQEFAGKLDFATEVVDRTLANQKTWPEKLHAIFQTILEFFAGKITKTYEGQQADAKLRSLVESLVDIEAKKQASIASKASNFNYMAPIEEGVKSLMEGARQKVSDIAGSDAIRNSRYPLVQAAGALTGVYANHRVEKFMEGVMAVRNKNIRGRMGIAISLIDQIKGPTDLLSKLLRESKNNERTRKDFIDDAARASLKAFADGGTKLSKEAKAGISAVFLRTGAHTLLGKYTMADIQTLVSDRSALDAQITATQAELAPLGILRHYMAKQANALAYYKATGRVKSQMMMMNAGNIARLYGTGKEGHITEQQAKMAQEVLERLVSLQAIRYSDSKHLGAASNVLRDESQRGNENGVEFVLGLHKKLENDSRERIFGGNGALMQHGYTPEIYNPHTEIRTANAAEGHELMLMGYQKGARVETDAADPDKVEKRIYSLRDGGLNPHLTGILSYTGLNSKGTPQHSGYMNTRSLEGQVNSQMQQEINAIKAAGIDDMFRPTPVRDLSNHPRTYMAPILNESGAVVNWRYLMHESTKDSVLERNNQFEKILGVMAGSIFDKETSPEQNHRALMALRDQHKADVRAGNVDGYIRIGKGVTDPELRQMWTLLPDTTKDSVRAIWGRDSMDVKVEALDMVFGYRKLSAAGMFKQKQEERRTNRERNAAGLSEPESKLNPVQQIVTAAVENVMSTYAGARLGMNPTDAALYAQRSAVMVARGERIWQELVRETKDIIVVKTGTVMLGNIWSNISLLMLRGIPMKNLARDHLIGMRGAMQYQSDRRELSHLQTLLETGYTQGKDAEIQKQITRLEDSLARNPVKDLIDAGLMPTIVEDLAQDADPYSFKSEFARKTEGITDKLHPKIRELGKAVYMTHDGKPYQTLARITQLSDFVARYALYQHLTYREKNPLSKEKAIQEASDDFVNYDIPMHRGMQYMDDMGALMFTKYFLRIQKVLLKVAKENPARVMTAMLAGHFMDLGPIVLDSEGLTRIGNNPFQGGALKLPGALGQLLTVNSVMSLIK